MTDEATLESSPELRKSETTTTSGDGMILTTKSTQQLLKGTRKGATGTASGDGLTLAVSDESIKIDGLLKPKKQDTTPDLKREFLKSIRELYQSIPEVQSSSGDCKVRIEVRCGSRAAIWEENLHRGTP